MFSREDLTGPFFWYVLPLQVELVRKFAKWNMMSLVQILLKISRQWQQDMKSSIGILRAVGLWNCQDECLWRWSHWQGWFYSFLCLFSDGHVNWQKDGERPSWKPGSFPSKYVSVSYSLSLLHKAAQKVKCWGHPVQDDLKGVVSGSLGLNSGKMESFVQVAKPPFKWMLGHDFTGFILFCNSHINVSLQISCDCGHNPLS